MLFPVGGRPEVLSLRMASQLVVRRALFAVLQRFVRLGDRLELLFSVFFLRDIGMELAGKLAIGFLDVFRRGAAFHAQCRVVILVFHFRCLRVGAPSWIGKSYRRPDRALPMLSNGYDPSIAHCIGDTTRPRLRDVPGK